MRKDALAVLIGVTGIQFAPALPSWTAGWAAAAIISILIVWWTGFRRVCFLLVGVLYAWARAQQDLSHRLPPLLAPVDVQATLQIESLVERRNASSVFDARILTMEPALPVRRARVSWYHAPATLQAAQRWSLPLRMRAPRGQRNPGGLDLESVWGRSGIDALATLRTGPAPQLLAARAYSPVLIVRQYLAGHLTQWAAGNPSAGVIAGLAVGETAAIPPELWSVFRAVGITHLMAISGTHVGMFGLLAAGLARLIWRRGQSGVGQRGAQFACALAAVVASLAYALLAGFSIPTQRTALMIAVVGIARMRARQLGASHILSLALVAVLLLDPTAPLQPGFWLSFVTVAWIFMLANGASPDSHWRQELRLQIGVSLLVLPISLYCFTQASLIAPVVNSLAIPAAGFVVVPGIILAASLAPLWPDAGQWIVQHLAMGLDWLWPLLRAAGQWPSAQVWAPDLPFGLVLVSAVAAMVLCLLPAASWRYMAALAAACVFVWPTPVLQRQEFDLTILDTGDAMSVVVLTANSTILYYRAAGGTASADVGAGALLPYLRSRGRDRVDLLVLSHVDAGNAAGLDTLFRDMPVLQTVGGGDFQAPCMSGQRFDRDGVAIRVLAPSDAQTEGTDASCVIWIGSPRASVLLPGDPDRAAEAALLARGAVWPATLVVVPARGSHLSSSPDFVQATRARWAVVTAAHLNRFGYPRPEVIQAWEEAGAQVRQVSQEGAITLRSRLDGSLTLGPGERLTNPRYWTAK